MAKAESSPPKGWTKNHADALAAMQALQVNKKAAQKALEALPDAESGELMRAALRSLHGGVQRPPAIPGSPGNAVPIATTAPPPKPPPAPPAPLPPPITPPIPKEPETGMRMQMAAAAPKPKVKQPPITIGPEAFGGPPPKAPISPAEAQTKAAPTEKPRVRIRAAGQRIPPAPLGGQPEEPEPESQPAPAEATKGGPVRIRTEEELEKLPIGAEFIWGDGHIYRKDA